MKNNKEKRTVDEYGRSSIFPEPQDGARSRQLIIAIVLFMSLGLLWSGITPVDEITTGVGAIKTQNPTEVVEHPDGGLVIKLYANVGDQVDAGDPIVQFDISYLERELHKLEATRQALLSESGRLKLLMDGPSIYVPRVLHDNLPLVEELFWAEQQFLLAQLQRIKSEADIIKEEINSLLVKRRSVYEEFKILSIQLERYEEAHEAGTATLLELETLQREHLQIKREVNEIDGSLAASRRTLKNNVFRRNELLAERRREAAIKLSGLQERMVSVEQNIVEINQRINRSTVVATVTGTVMSIAVSNPMEVVAPGDQIAEIVPQDSTLEAEIEVLADRIGSVKPLMEARLKILSYDFTRFGVLTGSVREISPSSYQNMAGEVVFRVVVDLPGGGVNTLLSGRPVTPGMTISVDIISERKTVLSYLLKPIRAIRDKAFSES